MESYKNHTEHLSDIAKLPILQTPSQEYKSIIEREAVTENVFLPIAHLSLLYCPENKYYFYIAVTLSLNGKNIFEYPDGNIPIYEKLALRMRARELLEPSGAFKRRIMDFIYNPDAVISRPWISYNHKELSRFVETEEIKRLAAITKKFMSEDMSHFIWVYGRRGSGRKTAVLCSCGLPVLFIDTSQIYQSADFERYLVEIISESKIMGAVICFFNVDSLLENKGLSNLLMRFIEQSAKVAFFVSEAAAPDIDRSNFCFAEINIPMPNNDISFQLWSLYSQKYEFDKPLDYRVLSSIFRLTPMQIEQCLEHVSNLAVMRSRDKLSAEQLYSVCRVRQTIKLPTLGRAVETGFTWDDLILSSDIKAMLHKVAERVIYKNKVYVDWGFAAKSPYGQGVTLLLEGPPGTGKTMTAHVIANELGLPMYRADMSAIMSKYIGETEKNVQALFDEANNIECVLFFDEAEALFSKRTDITDAKDKYSNLEVSFLLQKLEEHQGLTILASNLMQNFDDAFKRRFQFVVRIPFPDKELRKKIWESVLQTNVPVSGDIDFDYLSERFELTGSAIKSIILSAAFNAASTDGEVNMSHIMNALKEEISKSGVMLY